jgi:hypothetical protein
MQRVPFLLDWGPVWPGILLALDRSGSGMGSRTMIVAAGGVSFELDATGSYFVGTGPRIKSHVSSMQHVPRSARRQTRPVTGLYLFS